MNDGGRVWFVVLLLVFLHLVLRVALGVGSGAPDLLTVATLLGSRRVGVGAGAGLGFVLGLLEDAFSLLSFGANTVAFTLVGIVGGITRDLFVGDSGIFQLTFLFFGKFLRDAAYWVLAEPTVRGDFVDQVLLFGGGQALYAAVVGTIVLRLTGLWGGEEE